MLHPSSIQQTAAGSSPPSSARELSQALGNNQSAQVTVKQVTTTPARDGQPAQTNVVIQLGNKQYQIKTEQPPGQAITPPSQAVISRTPQGGLVLELLPQQGQRTSALINQNTAQPALTILNSVLPGAQNGSQTLPGNTASQQNAASAQTNSAPLTTTQQRTTPAQVNIGQPRAEALTISRPLVGQQSAPATTTNPGSPQTGSAAATSPAQATSQPAISNAQVTQATQPAAPTATIQATTQNTSAQANQTGPAASPVTTQQSASTQAPAGQTSTGSLPAQTPTSQTTPAAGNNTPATGTTAIGATASTTQTPITSQQATTSASTQAGATNTAPATGNQTTQISSTSTSSATTPGTNQPGSPSVTAAPVTTNQTRTLPAGQDTPQQVQILSQQGAALSKQLPLQRPVVVNVEQITPQPNGSQNVQVRVNGQSIQLQAPAPVLVTDKAVISRTEGNQAVFQPVNTDSRSEQTHRVISETLREVLPTQQPLANVLNQLSSIGQQNKQPENSALNRLVSSLISLYSVPADGSKESSQSVQRNLQNSGLFSERQLISSNQPQPTDLKAQLGQLLNAADSLPEQPRQQMLDLIKSLLNRVTQNQLESLQQNRTNPDGSIERQYALDLPVRQGAQLENVELKIAEYRRQAEEQEWKSSWKVRLHFDLEHQGTIDAEVLLEHDNEVTAQFWCSHTATTRLLADKLDGFNQHLQDQGFVINNLNCHTGKNATARNHVQQLIDIST